MSLSTFLRQPDVRKRFAAEFRKPRVPLKGQLLALPANPSHAGLIGTALDYLLRVHVAVLNTNIRERQWVAEAAIGLLRSRIAANQPIFVNGSRRASARTVARAEGIIRDARREYEKCKRRRCISAKMAQSALLLGQLDTFYRCSLLSAEFGRVRKSDVDELRLMLTIARRLAGTSFVASRVCILNPGFGEGSILVGGADADLLIDDTLIDIKATKHLKFTREMFNQLVGYYVISKIGGGITAAGRARPQIRHIGVYFARYGVFVRVPVAEFVNPTTFGAFQRWFKRRAQGSLFLGRTTIVTEDGTSVTF